MVKSFKKLLCLATENSKQFSQTAKRIFAGSINTLTRKNVTIFTENIEYDYDTSSIELPDNLAFQIDKYIISKFDLDKGFDELDEFIKNAIQDKTGAVVNKCDWHVVK